jgi:hypothetical protein
MGSNATRLAVKTEDKDGLKSLPMPEIRNWKWI